jgi:acetyl-CoA/propionyl-CoA carboxylase biotin carboxyl carrier protein
VNDIDDAVCACVQVGGSVGSSRALSKVLVANRGEIALRIMRACREEGLRSIAVYTDSEQDAPHVRYADEAIQLVSERPLPYLDIAALLRAATATNADAIHPGYGFLAENETFASECGRAGIVFVGPPPSAIAAMGDKVRAREAAIAAGVPVVPGSAGPVDADGARAFGDQHGYPVALKAASGGGGRGFRVARTAAEVDDAWHGASGEAARYFNDPTVYAERYLDHPRHVEIQVMADTHGHVVGLGERVWSIQRRHQKLLEEAPSPAVDAELRAAMNATAESLARAVNYVGAGTLEFLLHEGQYYFLEMNTRIQVEHPITEMVTGIDLVREQLRVAAGQPLSFACAPAPWGHAIECRVNAEDPARDFAPTPGALTELRLPAGFGVRVDTGFDAGGAIDPRFDSLVAKLIVWGRDRAEALSRLARALDDFTVEGVATTLPLIRALIRVEQFAAGAYDTGCLERSSLLARMTPWAPPTAADDDSGIAVEVNGRAYRVKLPPEFAGGQSAAVARRSAAGGPRRAPAAANAASADLLSPIQGTVLSVAVAQGDAVEAGQLICVVEAMKMENQITAHRAGVVRELRVQAGETVKPGGMIAVIGE